VLGEPSSTMPLVGASGAISGVLGAYLVKFPRAYVKTLIPLGIFTRILDIPAFAFLLFWIGLQLFFELASSRHEGGGVAYLAHLGGFIAGIILIFLFQDRGNGGAGDRDGFRYGPPPRRW
jgi:membrane associated rhomboid family serine protease